MVGDGEWMRRDREGCQFGREPFYARAERTWESRTSPKCGHGDSYKTLEAGDRIIYSEYSR